MDERLQAGFARLDITPPLGVRIVGYYITRIGDGVLDPLYLNAIAFKKGGKTSVILVCDLLSIVGDLAPKLPKMVAESVGIEEEGVFICHTHTHTGPVVDSYREPNDPLYTEWFKRRLCDAAALAIADCKAVRGIYGAEDALDGMAFSRRFRMKDGRVTKPAYADPDIADFAEPFDNTMRVVRVERENAKEIVLVNFQAHPDHLGGTKYSADYPSVLRQTVEKERNAHCVFFNGAEGNMSSRSRKVPLRFKGYEGMKQYGRELGSCAIRLCSEAKEIEGDGLTFRRITISPKTKLDEADLKTAEHIAALFHADRLDEIKAELQHPEDYSGVCAEALHLIYLRDHDLHNIDMFLTAVNFGGIVFVGIPGEPFAQVGMDIRAASPYAMTCICCHTNGTVGYFPTADAYDSGGYEPYNTRFAKGAAEQVRDEAIKLLNKMKEEE